MQPGGQPAVNEETAGLPAVCRDTLLESASADVLLPGPQDH